MEQRRRPTPRRSCHLHVHDEAFRTNGSTMESPHSRTQPDWRVERRALVDGGEEMEVKKNWLPQGTSQGASLASQGRDETEEKRLPQEPSSRTEEQKSRRGGCHGNGGEEEMPSGKKGLQFWDPN